MKRIFLLVCLIPALLLCSCGKDQAAATTQTTTAPAAEEAPINEVEMLKTISAEVAIAYAYGNFSDVQDRMLFSPEQQTQMLFPDQSAPYQYGPYSFASWDAVEESVRGMLVSNENADFSATITNQVVEIFPAPSQDPEFMKMAETRLFDVDAQVATKGAKVTVTLAIDGGEEPSGTIEVYFLCVDSWWQVCSPSVSGYFIQLYDLPGTN